MILLSTTAFNQAARCLKLYEYANVAKIIPKHGDLNPKVRKGIWVHKALETYHSSPDDASWQRALDDLYAWGIAHSVSEDKLDEAYSASRDLVSMYIDYWNDHDDVLKGARVLGSEIPCTYDSDRLEAQLRATVDMVVEIPRKGVWVVEHKSTGHIPDANWRCSDPQTAMQVVLAERHFNVTVNGVLFNYLWTNEAKVPAIKKDYSGFYANAGVTTSAKFEEGWHELYSHWRGTHGEAMAYKDEAYARLVNDNLWFQRYEVYRPKGHIVQTMKDIQGVVDSIKMAQNRNHYPRSYHIIACSQFCPYSQLCSAEYQMGKESPERREADFILDTGDREGR